MNNLRKWHVYSRKEDEFGYGSSIFLYDIVFFDQKITAPEIYNSLINHDGYPVDIILQWTHLNEHGEIVYCEYPSECYEEGDEYDKEIVIKNIIPGRYDE